MKTATCLAILLLLPLLSCRNHSNSNHIWKWTLESRSYAQPLVDGGRVYVVSQAGEVISGDPATGEKNWTVRLKGQILAEPAILDGRLFSATENGWVAALETRSGRTIWQRQLDGDGFMAPLSVQGDLLLAPSRTGTLYALSSTTGSLLWSVPGNTKYSSRAIIHGSRIYVGGWARDFLCLNQDGAVSWQFRAAQIIAEDALVDRNMVYFSAYDHFVYALDAISGRMMWRYPVSKPTRPYLIHRNLVVATDQDFHVLQPEDGRLLRRLSPRTRIARCFSTNGRLLFSVSGTKIFELDPDHLTMSLLLQPQFPLFKLSWADEILVATDELYGVYGFRLREK